MLSVGSRDEGRRRSVLGLEGRGGERRRDMEENELEEGEAYPGQEDDIDPDALSYIDEKLQHVLGHFQKEFEGGVSSGTLGAQFGGYGSFLPAYQRSPPILLSQPKSPAKVPGHSLSRSPYNLQPEVGCQNASVLANASIAKANIASSVQPTEKSSKRDTCISSCSTEGITQHESTRQTMDSRDPKSLKVRIKVGPDSVLTRNKPEIYSDLGLDVSPSPSLEDSPGGSRELSPESPATFCESPSTILQIMTSFSVPGGYFLSPLSATLLHLFEKEDTSIKNFKRSMPQKVVLENYTASSDTSLHAKDVRDTYKENKSREKGRKLLPTHGLTCEDVITTSLKNEIGSKTPAAHKVVLSAQDMALSSSAQSVDAKEETYVGGNSIKECSKMFKIHNEPNKIPMMEGVHAIDLRKDNHLEFTDSMGMDGADSSDKETIPSKEKAYSKTLFAEKAFEETNGKFDMCRKSKSKSQKNPDKKKAESDKHRMRKDYAAGCEEHVKEQLAQKTCSSEKIVFKMMQDKGQALEGEKIIQGSQNSGSLFVEPNKEKQSTVFSVAFKGKKKMSHVKGAHLETKSKISKSQKELNKVHNTESQSELLMSAQAQQVENVRHVLGSSRSTEKSMEKSEINKVEHFRNTGPAIDVPAVMNDAVPNNDSVPAIPALVLIEDNWVCCDICQRWRLLPYGTNPESLPKKWQCSMQVWLPGLNNCNVSQDETTKAFHELYQFPAPGSDTNLTAHLNAAASSVTSADTLNPGRRLENVMHNVSLSGKKKHGSMDATDLLNDSSLTHLPNSSKNFLASSGNKDFNDIGYCMEMDSLIKPKPGLTSRSMDIAEEKHIHKQENHKPGSSFKVGGDLTERLGKYSKPMSKRGTDVDGHRISKKLKKDGSYHSLKDFHSSIETSGEMAVNGDTELLAKVPRNTLQNYSDHSSSKDLKSKSASCRKSWEQANSSNGKHKEISSASEAERSDKYDSSDKKRILKERQESQACQEISMSSEQVAGSRPMLKESLIESELRRQKKAKVAKSEGKEAHAVVGGGNIEMKGCSTRIALSSNRKQLPDVIDNDGVRPATDGQMVHYQGNATSGQALDCMDGLKRDVTYMRSLAAATSSSSKVSGSQKGKVNLPEARGSPVESVSSSPMRILNTENNSARRNSSIKDNVISMGYSGMGSPKRFSDGELDGSSDQSGTRAKDPASNNCLRSSETYRFAESGVLDSLKGSHDYQDAETNCLPGVKAIDGKYSKIVKHDDVLSTDPGKLKILCVNGNVPHQPKKYHLERSDNNHTCNDDEHCASGQKSSVKSSLYPKDKRRNLDFDSDKGKLKVFGSITEHKDFHSMRTCNNHRSDVEFDHLNSSKKDDLESHSKQHKDHDSRDAIAGVSRSKPAPQQNLQKASSHERQNPSVHLISEAIDRSVVEFGKGMQSSNTAKDKLEKKVWGPQTAPESIKGTNLEQFSVDAVNSEASKSAKSSRKFDEQNGTLPIPLWQSATSVPGSSSPVKKDGHPSVNAFIKEARDLKHYANRLKSIGSEDESSGVFFESALKFLHAASLLEPPNAENARQGELVPSMQMYYDTAKFCEFCAHEYERLKEMVAAALAYKCAEVAYLKVAYYKHPSASKDRLELQVALDAPLPGESPSSSASDVDNLNNQGGLDKAASARAVSSPQIASNHAIAARNRPHVMRLLTYTNYLNCAFEATRKSQNAIAAASTELQKNGIDVCTARKVLDFNFHNVEGLLRLVRLSINSIGH